MKGGMDFPDDITTNVFRVGDIQEIHWVLYTRKPKDESALQNQVSSEEEKDSAHLLQLAEYILREDGGHALLDKNKAGVWVFSLSQALDKGTAQKLGLDYLEITSVGCVRSGDLFAAMSPNASAPPSTKAARYSQATAAAIGELNTQAVGSNASTNTQPTINEPSHKRKGAWDASQNRSISEVYSNLVSAVSRSLSHSLGKRQGWIQVDPCTCIDVRTLGYDLFNEAELHSWATTTTLSFDVRLLSSRTLLISFIRVRLPRYTTMSAMLAKDGTPSGFLVGLPLLLSPSGIRCRYLGMEDVPKSDVQRKSTMQAKASTLSCLAHQGVRNVSDVTWIQVQMEPESNLSVGPPVSLWPSHLCFCEDVMAPVGGEDAVSFSRSNVEGLTDPMEEAESWFLGKAARMEASQARAWEKTQGAQVMKDAEDTDDEDCLSPVEFPTDQGITPQDVSGIYPTPPDGLPPALLASSNPNNLQMADYEDDEKELKPSDQVRGDYDDGQENDDLFGDMDIDMFASNGLTEADFSFFDEPGMIDEDLRETGQVMTLDDANETTDHLIAFNEQGLITTPHERREDEQDRNVAKDQEDAIVEQEINHVLPMTDNKLPPKDHNKAIKSTVNIKDVDYGALEQLNLHRVMTVQDTHGGQRGSFEHVAFSGPAFSFDDKYNMQGRFAFDVDELPIHPKHGDRCFHSENHLSKISICPENSPMEDSVITDREEEDAPAREDSDLHAAMDLSPELQVESSRKRKREQLDEHDHPETPLSSIALAGSLASSPQDALDEPMSGLSEPNALEQTKDMVDLEPLSHRRSNMSFTGRGQDFIEVAQVIAHHALSGLLQSRIECYEESNLVVQSMPDRSLQNMMTHLVLTFFPTNKRCSLKEYASLWEKNPASVSREQLLLNQRSLKPTHIAGGLTSTGHSIFKLDSPYTRVRRNGTSTEISASALSFWEELSLGPSHETKDNDVFCVCPKNIYIEAGVMAFLNMMKGAYQSCNLGSHNLGASLADCSNRIVTAPMNPNPDTLLQNIATTCEGLGTKLPELGLQSGTIVIYIINPFKDQQYLPGLCNAFLRLPNAYRVALEKRRLEGQRNLVMQIVPLDLVWSPECIAMPSPADYRRLAFEVYNKCDTSERGHHRDSNFTTTPAIRLAKTMPKSIDFKLISESSAPFMQTDSFVHMSYSWDASNEWLAAIWTDNVGILSWRACYWLGKNKEMPWKSLFEALKEILETSFGMLHPPNAPWRLIVCKDSPIAKMENDVWLRALAESSRPSTACTILTVDVNPPLTLTCSDLQRSSSDVAPGLSATPGATPQTNTPSPDISGLGATPAGNTAQVGTPPANAALGDHDSEARLIDVIDETWGVVMDGTLDDLGTLSDKCPSLASGYLVKRAGPRDEDGLIPLGVNLVHGQKPYRAVLKEVLGMYRNLGTLARVKGVVHPVKSVLPLHVAAARRARKVLSETMRYEPK